MKRILVISFILAFFLAVSAQNESDIQRIEASQGGASPLMFTTARNDIPNINPGNFSSDKECIVRGGLPRLKKKIAGKEPVTISFIGGSITQGDFCYRLQLAKYLEQAYPSTKFTWTNAGVSGTGTDLGAFRVKEQVLAYKPDVVFIEFAVNGGYPQGTEGIIRLIKKANPDIDICLLYAISNGQTEIYRKGGMPEVIARLEKIADYYDIPSVHMAMEAVDLETNNKLLWKGNKDDADGLIVFSPDGIHPNKDGGCIYASAIARSLKKCLMVKTKKRAMPSTAIFSDDWDYADMYDPNEICVKRGIWKNIMSSESKNFKTFTPWFKTVLYSGHPGSCLSFAFDGDMFGIFDIGGPEMGQIEIFVDGQFVNLKKVGNSAFRLFETEDLDGTHFVNRFNGYCNNRYRGQYELIKVEKGLHQITIRLCDQKVDKRKILGDKQLSDITENPWKYDSCSVAIGRILIRGKLAKAHPVKGLPKLAQQMKWETKLRNYAKADSIQAKLRDVNLVVGSSSIELWKSLEKDFPGKNVINRGISGSKAIDLYNYRYRLIEPYDAKNIFVYEGDNEIGYKWEIPEMMEQIKKLFFEIRRMKPNAGIYLVSVKPSPAREKSLEKIQEVNRQIKDFVTKQPNAGYVDIYTPMLDKDGHVRVELYRKDHLHPTPEAYSIWRNEFAKIINK
jgi:lysophospholipase L1-like esterase